MVLANINDAFVPIDLVVLHVSFAFWPMPSSNISNHIEARRNVEKGKEEIHFFYL